MDKDPLRRRHKHTTRVLPIVGLDVGAIGSISLVSFGSGGRNSFKHQNKFFIFEQIMNFGCQRRLFNSPTIGNTCPQYATLDKYYLAAPLYWPTSLQQLWFLNSATQSFTVQFFIQLCLGLDVFQDNCTIYFQLLFFNHQLSGPDFYYGAQP